MCREMFTFEWQKPYSVQHSAQGGQPCRCWSSEGGALKGGAGQEPEPRPAPRHPVLVRDMEELRIS